MPEISDRIGKGDRAKVGRGDPPDVEKPDLMREGEAPSTQAGEFVREEIEHVREGKHGARSARQAIAIGLSKARRAGVKMAPPRPDRATPSPVKATRPRRGARSGRGAVPRAARPPRESVGGGNEPC
jgi:hypothetical protein